MASKMWDDITYPFSNFNGATVVERIDYFIPYFIMDVISYYRDESRTKLVKGHLIV